MVPNYFIQIVSLKNSTYQSNTSSGLFTKKYTIFNQDFKILNTEEKIYAKIATKYGKSIALDNP
ncbi:hypothetical protein BpHYR1_027679 [Brachionus plicatilis]|uniref:Uncharacterized protein n=1 Tax=Brachionus plicatilis TaxID=10195 RepID=A0A3M7QCP6_BRAPC|nr:hypothetical protein BpHYR1_027679 [Brachionus plicatilis]